LTQPPLCECGIRHPQIPSSEVPDTLLNDPETLLGYKDIETIRVEGGRL
jgi:hypothetical protein